MQVDTEKVRALTFLSQEAQVRISKKLNWIITSSIREGTYILTFRNPKLPSA